MGQEIILPSKRLVSATGEALSAPGGIRLIACPRPLSEERIEIELPEGLTIFEMMERSGIDRRVWQFSHVWLSDPTDWTKDPVHVPQEYWHVVRPKPGITVTLRAAPGKGGGSKGGLGIVLRVVVMVIAAVVTWGVGNIAALGANAALAGALAGAAVSVVGNLLITALIPPPRGPQPPLIDNSRTDSKAYSITGSRNQANPYGVVPRIFGRFRYTPPYGANPYTEIIGNDQYIRLLFNFGYGPLVLEDPKIGETPLDNYQDVEMVVRQGYPDDPPLSLFSNDIQEEPFSVELTNDELHTPGAKATGLLTLTGNFLAGDTVQIGRRRYRLVDALDGTADQVLIGESIAISLDNLMAAINRGAGAGTVYAAAIIVNADVTAASLGSNALRVTARVSGADANSIGTTTVSANAAWGTATLTGGSTKDAVQYRDYAATGVLDFFSNLTDGLPTGDHDLGGVADRIVIGNTTFMAGVQGDHVKSWLFEVADTMAGTIRNFVTALERTRSGPVLGQIVGSSVVVTERSAGDFGNSVRLSTNNSRTAWRTPTLRGGISDYQINPLLEDEKWLSRTSQDDADELTLDVTFPQGLVRYTPLGEKASRTVRFDIRYRPFGSEDDWTYVSTQAKGVLTLTANPSTGDTVTIGHDTYTFVSGLSDARDVKRGATLAESIDNLAAAINAGDGAGVKYDSGTKRHVMVTASVDGTVLTVTARHVGSATGIDGNNILLYTLGTSGGWDAGMMRGGVDALSKTAKDTSVRVGKRIILPVRGKYDIQIRRLTPNATTTDVFDRSYWTILRTVRYSAPINMTGIATVEMRIRATDQLNGVVDSFNMIATSILRAWNGDSWVQQPTRNPSACYIEALCGIANKKRRSDEEVYWPDFEAWAADCDSVGQDGQPKFCCDGVVDYQTTVEQMLADIASTGRATRGIRDGKHSIVRDIPQTVPVQHFTPRNSRPGTKWTKQIIEIPHGLRVRFPNEEKGWQMDERIVYADGYDKSNATVFQTFDLPLTTRTNQIWRDTRYHMGQVLLRPVTYQISTDPEYLACRRGDLIASAHDVLLHGLASGRIKRVTIDEESGMGTALLLDERVPMVAGKTYGLRVRYSSGVQRVIPVQTDPGEKNLVTPVLPIAVDDLPARADLFSFGETGREAVMLIVNSIKPDDDLGATLTLLDAAPAIHNLDTGEIPPYDSQITLPPVVRRQPPKPVVTNVQSDESVLAVMPDGSLLSQIVITIAALSGGDMPAALIQPQYRRTGSDAWTNLPNVTADQGILNVQPVDDGETYDVRLRTISATGIASDWTVIPAHKVIGKTTPPPKPRLRVENGVARWTYPFVPRDLKGTLIRQRPGTSIIWEQGTSLIPDDGVLPVNEFVLPRFVSDVTTVMVKSIDTAGNESLDCAAVIVASPDNITLNLLHAEDQAALDWPGTITDGSVVGGVLISAAQDGEFWGDSGSAFWADDPQAPFWDSGFRPMTYEVRVLPLPNDAPCLLEVQATISGAPWVVEYRKGNQQPFWGAVPATPFWQNDPLAPFWAVDDAADEWWPWPGRLDIAARQPIDLRITTQGGSRATVIDSLQFVFGAEDAVEDFDDFAVPIGGAVLPITKPMRRIKNIRLTVVDDGGPAVSARTLDKQSLRIGTFDKAALPAAGTVDATITGVKGRS